MLSKSLQYFMGYTSISVLLISWSIYNSLETSPNAFTFLVEFTDGYKLTILLNFLLLCFLLSGKLMQMLLFGELRIIEAEHLVEKLPIFFINLLFNLATNDNNLILNCVLLGISVTFKIFHIILIDRLDFVHMKIYNNSTNDTYTTLKVLQKYLTSLYFWMTLSFIIGDFAVAKFLVYDVFQGINSVTCLLFGFQFAVQGVEALTYYSKLLLNIYELAFFRNQDDDFDIDNPEEEEDEDNERVWENKAFFSKSVDICSASLKAVSYLAFIYLLTIHSGLSLPISMLQGTYLSMKQMYKEVSQLFNFIESSKKLDSQLPNATKEELEACDNLCIICREDMLALDEYERTHRKKMSGRRYPKKLKCGHILHMGCLKDWLERSEICPLCRRKVFQNEQQPEAQTQADETNQNEELPDRPQAAEPAANNQQQRDDNELRSTQVEEERDIPNRSQDILNELNIPAEYPENQRTPDTSTSTSSRTIEPLESYQSIRLPTSAIIPQDWTILPLHKSSKDEYRVDFSTRNQGSLIIKPRPSGGELSIIEPTSYTLHDPTNFNDNVNVHDTSYAD